MDCQGEKHNTSSVQRKNCPPIIIGKLYIKLLTQEVPIPKKMQTTFLKWEIKTKFMHPTACFYL